MPRRPAVVAAPTNLERHTAWCGLRAGDPVDVLDVRQRGASWRFVAYVTNVVTHEDWVEVTGGKAGDERPRSFRPEQLYPHKTVKAGVATSAPLVAEPRLPL